MSDLKRYVIIVLITVGIHTIIVTAKYVAEAFGCDSIAMTSFITTMLIYLNVQRWIGDE